VLAIRVTLTIEYKRRTKALAPSRIIFLREQGDKLKESYIRYVHTLKLGGSSLGALVAKSWRGLDISNWPDSSTIDQIQSEIENQKLTAPYTRRSIRKSFDNLLSSMEDVMRISGTAVFEGNEELTKHVLFGAYYHVSNLEPKLILLSQLPTSQILSNIIKIEKDLKKAATSTGEVLIDICKLADEVKPFIPGK
jgi:hypothetical protein